MNVSRWIFRLLAVAAGGIVCGFIGLILGASIGGNTQDFTFNGMPGYEGGAQLGFVIGSVVGCIGVSAILLILAFTQKRLRK